MSVAKPENCPETEATVLQEFSAFETFFRLGLGHECPSYSNRTTEKSDFSRVLDQFALDFRTAPTKRPT